MSKRQRLVLAVVLDLVGSLMLVGFIYLAYVFPRTEALWQDQDRALPVCAVLLVNLSHFCRNFGLFLFPLFVSWSVAGGIWVMVEARKKQEK